MSRTLLITGAVVSGATAVVKRKVAGDRQVAGRIPRFDAVVIERIGCQTAEARPSGW